MDVSEENIIPPEDHTVNIPSFTSPLSNIISPLRWIEGKISKHLK